MSTPQLLQDHRLHLAGLLEAIQRCVCSFLTPDLFAAAYRFVKYSADVLGVGPLTSDFAPEFEQITSPAGQRS